MPSGAACAQLGKELALQRKQLRLFRHPLRTLYYFAACAGGAACSGAVWLARHRLTLFLLVPALLAYACLKLTGASANGCLPLLALLLLSEMQGASGLAPHQLTLILLVPALVVHPFLKLTGASALSWPTSCSLSCMEPRGCRASG